MRTAWDAENLAHLKPYLMGESDAHARPLMRFLPPIPAGMITNILTSLPQNDGIILDPFGISPDMDLEIAKMGKNVLVCVNNPITRIILELAAQPPSRDELNRVALIFTTAMKGSQRLEQEIRSLYLTTCRSCGKSIEADRYKWERDNLQPTSVEYACPDCGNNGDYPINASDLKSLAPVTRIPLQRAWAIERIAPMGDALRDEATTLVDAHLPRALYVIFLLINKLDSLELTAREKLIAHGLLLDVLDAANPLQQVEHVIHRPKLLLVPGKFYEHHLWKKLEAAINRWPMGDKKTSITIYPEMPVGGGICLFAGKLRELAELHESETPSTIMAVFPRPNQAFWTLSAIWSAWLSGREATGQILQVINRRRYDWNWQTSALAGTLAHVKRSASANAKLIAILPEVESAFLVSAFLAIAQNGYQCEGLAIRDEDEICQMTWKPQLATTRKPFKDLGDLIASSAVEYLQLKGEPADYLEMTAQACLAVDAAGGWPVDITQSAALQLTRGAFSNPLEITHYGSGEETLESGWWWLKRPPDGLTSLADRIEECVVTELRKGKPVRLRVLEQNLRKNMKPLLCQIETYLQHLLASYADEEPKGSGDWLVKVNENRTLRLSDIKTMNDLIGKIGTRLGFQLKETTDGVAWQEGLEGPIKYQFIVRVSACLSNKISASVIYHGQYVMVLPGSRSNLMAYKLEQNPWLSERITRDWHLVKFRHICQLAENPMLTEESMKLWLDLDPPEYQPLQMGLF